MDTVFALSLQVMAATIFNKAFSLFLAFFFAFQAIGVTVDVHYCKGEMQSISFFGEATPCTKANSENLHACCKKRLEKLTSKDGLKKDDHCCLNELFHLQLEGEYEVVTIAQIDTELAIIPNPCAEHQLTFEINQPHLIPDNTDPPPISPDLNVLYQVFRI